MFTRSSLTLAIAALVSAPFAVAETPSIEAMWELVQQQQAEITALKSQLKQTDKKIVVTTELLAETDIKVEATAEIIEQGAQGLGSIGRASWAEKTQLGGYGEHHFNHFEDGTDKIDAHRFVLFFGHQFTDDLRFFSEFELEHSLAGEGKPGEVELEQAYIEWDYSKNQSLVAGQFLIPIGLINETHEPETFYGTERNKVEKNIIPATWWETGVMFQGEIAPGLSYNAALHSGLAADDGGKIRGGRQKSAKASAEDLAYTARLKYTGIQGLELAASVQYQSDLTQGLAIDDTDGVLLEAHAVYNRGPLSVRALWAEWDIEGETFALNGTDEQTGWYVEPSYKVTDDLGLFIRYSEYNNTAGIVSDDSKTWDYGLNYWLNPRVVVKADYSNNVDKDGADNDSFNLGLGWSF